MLAKKRVKDKLIIGIESTCDETSIALVKNGTDVIYELTLSQVKKHAKFGGVVPELAAREHIKNFKYLGNKFFVKIKDSLDDVTAIAVAAKIGLPPAVSVGEAYATGISKALNKPLIKINHVLAHIWGVWVDPEFIVKPDFPFLGLIVSGGHTILAKFTSPTEYKILGQTVDDAAGETFDKVARVLELGYPGGPVIEQIARTGDEFAYKFPVPLKDSDDYNFSFSGLKTAVRYFIEKNKHMVPGYMLKYFKADVAASFQYAILSALVNKVKKAIDDTGIKTVVIGGGVAANQRLVDLLAQSTNGVALYVPHLKYTGDNAALIAGYAYNFV